ncbi:MAG: four helix bundle protein [Chloroflexi bacterium]|nr:four helix bundle protein [Chloroflexota bacterium]
MNYDNWVKTVPNEITDDSLWQVEAYRLALFLSEICWHDTSKLIQDQRMRGLSDQLYRAVGSVSANIAEGYSKSTGRDRARFYEYALGSARESRDWYYKAHHLLSEEVIKHRMSLTTQIIRLLITMVPQQRNSKGIREEKESYKVNTTSDIYKAPMP